MLYSLFLIILYDIHLIARIISAKEPKQGIKIKYHKCFPSRALRGVIDVINIPITITVLTVEVIR